MQKSQLKNIVFFFDPWIELSSEFRLGDFEYRLQANMQPLLKEFHDIQVTCMVSDHFMQVIQAHGVKLPEQLKWVQLPYEKIRRVYGSYVQGSVDFLKDQASPESLQQLAEIVRAAAGNLVADVVLMHESHAPYLQQVWPDALVLHGMFGVTHRAPFPRTYFYDANGLYSKSLLASHCQEILDSTTVDARDERLLGQIRSWYGAQILPHDPVWRHAEVIRHKYEKILLLPLQVDNYFAFDGCTQFANQLEFMEHVLETVPSNWGVWVTRHGEYASSVDSYLLEGFAKKYSNFIYVDALDAVPTVSTCLLAHVDGVVSVSSSVALQAAVIYDLPVVAAGQSHINCIATCGLEQLPQMFEIHANDHAYQANRLKMVKFVLSKYTLFNDAQLGSAHWLVNYLEQMLTLRAQGLSPLACLPETALDDFLDKLKTTSQWRLWLRYLDQAGVKPCPHPVLARLPFYDAVSWDMFDTLVDRPFIEPHELFQLMERPVRRYLNNIYFPFHYLRREAERRARSANGNRFEITIQEIYAELQVISGLDAARVAHILELELNYERQVIARRSDMGRTWNLAKVFGKHRAIITDIYFSQEFIEENLQACGYEGWDELFVSSEWRTRKDDGTIYPSYIEAVSRKFDYRPQFLHIGDNPRADRDMATPFGIDAYVIPKSMDVLRQSKIGSAQALAFRQRSFDTSVVLGVQSSRRFSRPENFKKDDSWSEGDLFNIGYSVFGPLILGYTQWLIRRLKANKVDRAYFLARDGYLIMKAYEKFEQCFDGLPPSDYLLCSRRGVMVPGIFSMQDIEEIATLNFGVMEISDFLKSRFGVDIQQVPAQVLRSYGFAKSGNSKIRFPGDLPKVMKFCKEISEIIFQQAQAERTPYLEYLEDIGFNACKNPAFVDIGYSGTMQRKIEKISGKDVSGFYMFTHNYVLDYFGDKCFESWIADFDSQRSCYRHVFNEYIPLLESFLSSDAGSFVSFTEGKDINYLYASNEADRCAFIRKSHAGVLAFIDDFLQRFGKFALEVELSTEVSTKSMEFFGLAPHVEDINTIRGVVLENMFAGAEFDLIADHAAYVDKQGRLSAKHIEALVSRSKWKTAASIYYNALNQAAAPVVAPVAASPTVPVQAAPVAVKPVVPALVQAAPAVAADVRSTSQLSKQDRLRRKFERDPQRFFLDSKHLMLRSIGHLHSVPVVARQSENLVRKLKGWED